MNPKFIQHDVFVLDWNLICPHVIVGGGGKTIDRNFGAVSITRELNNLGPDKLSPMDHVIGDVDRLKKSPIRRPLRLRPRHQTHTRDILQGCPLPN